MTEEDPIRDLLNSVAISPFQWTPAGQVAIMQSKVVEAGGDPEAVGQWVEEHGGSIEKTSPMGARTAQTAYGAKPRGEYFYAVPEQALAKDAEPA